MSWEHPSTSTSSHSWPFIVSLFLWNLRASTWNVIAPSLLQFYWACLGCCVTCMQLLFITTLQLWPRSVIRTRMPFQNVHQRLFGYPRRKKDVGKARETEEIVVPVLAGNTAKSARGMDYTWRRVCWIRILYCTVFAASISIVFLSWISRRLQRNMFATSSYKNSE